MGADRNLYHRTFRGCLFPRLLSTLCGKFPQQSGSHEAQALIPAFTQILLSILKHDASPAGIVSSFTWYQRESDTETDSCVQDRDGTVTPACTVGGTCGWPRPSDLMQGVTRSKLKPSSANKVRHGKTQSCGLLDEALISSLVQVRSTGENPEKAAIRRTHHSGLVFRIKSENPIVPFT